MIVGEGLEAIPTHSTKPGYSRAKVFCSAYCPPARLIPSAKTRSVSDRQLRLCSWPSAWQHELLVCYQRTRLLYHPQSNAMKTTFFFTVLLAAGISTAAQAQSTPTTTPAASPTNTTPTVQPQVGQGTREGNYGQPATSGVSERTSPTATPPAGGATIETQIGTGTREGNYGQPAPGTTPTPIGTVRTQATGGVPANSTSGSGKAKTDKSTMKNKKQQ